MLSRFTARRRYPRDSTKSLPTDRTRLRALLFSYGPDWVLTIFLWGIFYLLDKVDGYRRLFSINDTSLLHPYAEHERVPTWALALIGGVFPLVFILCTAAFWTRSFWDAHCGVLGLALSLGITSTFTDIVKIVAGRPRPDIVSRCVPQQGYTSNPLYGLTSWTVCTRTDLLNDGFRSFFSGHASFSWCGMVYLALYAAGKMHIHDRRGHTFKSWLLLIPISAATLVSLSRTMDYRHHSTDVIAGGIVGTLIGWYCYRQYYPSLYAPRSEKPYSPRIPRSSTTAAASGVGGIISDDEHSSGHYQNSKGPILPLNSMSRVGGGGGDDRINVGHGGGNGVGGGGGGGDGGGRTSTDRLYDSNLTSGGAQHQTVALSSGAGGGQYQHPHQQLPPLPQHSESQMRVHQAVAPGAAPVEARFV